MDAKKTDVMRDKHPHLSIIGGGGEIHFNYILLTVRG